MNITSIDHFKSHFPNEDITGFNTIYYSQGSEDAFAFIAIKGAMKDVKVFVKGDYNEESLERRLFALISKYGEKPGSGRESIIDDDIWKDEEEIREGMVSLPKRKLSETMYIAVIMSLLTALEAITLFVAWLIGMSLEHTAIVGVMAVVVNLVLFCIFKKQNIRKGKDDFL